MHDENLSNVPLEVLHSANNSLELDCLMQQHADPSPEDPVGGCPIYFDSVMCWPKTQPATWAILPCFKEFKGIKYDITQNASRFCHLDGTWDDHTNYEQCTHLPEQSLTPEFELFVELPTIIYYTGYTLSLVALILAVIVFIRYKELRCLRNTIHGNLFLTYILSSFVWILILTLQITVRPSASGCIFLVILLNYFSLTNFFWMMVEGLYLYMLVVETFSSDRLRFHMYALIGWGGPAIFVLCWAIAKGFSPGSPSTSGHLDLATECPWMKESDVDWIFQGPACAVILINLIFLLRIMWVLITKLRSANTAETRQYRKASKALLVLIPLLGITYLIVLIGPHEGIGRYIFVFTRTVLLSTQGFAVSLLYCFLNSEVRQVLRHRFDRWQDERNIRNGHAVRNRRYNVKDSKDYSQRSRTESIRLTYSYPTT